MLGKPNHITFFQQQPEHEKTFIGYIIDTAPELKISGFYRIKTIEKDTLYTDIIRVSFITGMPAIKIWPVPFDHVITVEIDSKIQEEFTRSCRARTRSRRRP